MIPYVVLDDVFVAYPDAKTRQPRVVLNNIHLRVRPGEFVTIVGPSGCGKSTLLRMVLGSERPTSGMVSVDGKPVIQPDRDRGIVFQRYSLFPHLTVLENVALGLGLEEFSLFGNYFSFSKRRRKRNEFRSHAFSFLERVGLAEHADKYPHHLSGGMRQRAAIAQALIMNPKILLMDEPFGALDISTRQDMQLFILEQWKNLQTTIFFVTHDLEEAVYLGTRLIVLSQYYRDANGAKIVADKAIPGPHPKPKEAKYTEEFGRMLEDVHLSGLAPQQLQHIDDFDLDHPDSWRPSSQNNSEAV